MGIALQRIQSKIGYDPPPKASSGRESQWGFRDFLAKQKLDYFQPFVQKHAILTFEYSVFCTRLADRLIKSGTQSETRSIEWEEEITEQVAAAMMMAELLAHIYRHYLSVPREVKRLLDEQSIYRSVLKKRGYHFDESCQDSMPSPGFFSQKVRSTHVILNWPRLFTVRIRRVLTTLILLPEAKKFDHFCRFIIFADRFVNPVLTHLSWLFFVPRFVTNVFLLLEHVIPGSWLDSYEKDLPWYIRVQAQLEQCWFELGNDTAWLTGGLLNCFVLTGPLAPVGMYLTISLFLFDVLWAGLRAYIELGRIKGLEVEYANLLSYMEQDGTSAADLAELQSLQEYLQQRMQFEHERLMLSVVNTTVLFFGMCFALPLLTNPLFALIGAVLVLATTCIIYNKVQSLETKRPVNRIMELRQPQYALLLEKTGMFKENGIKEGTTLEPTQGTIVGLSPSSLIKD
ncbi:Uncharacterised protein [Legionella lansingensis]|uniref:Coiled-coil protein n=1 Tax=Legionella lansingensis TaxID=45067 RepID=A0A0W0VLK2_9GAMM|nr:hypothetical protein [Legionella lansingensis]KTD20963.1 hypothetical protein Llan_1693 [Legionella lansingensis]SNV44584.1 Uncharacterised protein [Legionella lansingensis]